MEYLRVNESGQITLPRGIMEKLGLENGSNVYLFETKGRVILQNTELEALDLLKAYEKGDIELDEDDILDEVVKVCKQVRREIALERRNP